MAHRSTLQLPKSVRTTVPMLLGVVALLLPTGDIRAQRSTGCAIRDIPAPELCARVRLDTVRATYIVLLDESGSMRPIGGIYRSLFMQTRGALKRELQAHLRTHRVMRRSRPATHRGQGRGDIADAVSISERPATVADRAVPGHWEGDLIQRANFTFIATLVERWSRYVHLVRVTSKETDVVTAALIREVRRLPTGLMASLTWDRAKEMAQHRRFTVATDVAVYFCDPRSPWQRDSNENTNGLLRQYFPQGMDLSQVTQRQLDAVARQLNTRPRETLGLRTPAAKLAEAVALTG